MENIKWQLTFLSLKFKTLTQNFKRLRKNQISKPKFKSIISKKEFIKIKLKKKKYIEILRKKWKNTTNNK